MEILRFMDSIKNTPCNYIFSFFSMFGEEIFVIGVLCTVYWCINKKLAYKLCFTYFISGLLVQGLKVTFRINRPWVFDDSLKPIASARETATGYSFPSGHTQGATGFFGALAFHYNKKKLYIACFGVIAMVMLSRMYLLVHTPKDVAASFLVTIVVAFIVNYVYENFNSYHGINVAIFIMLELISAALMIYTLILIDMDKTTVELAMDTIKASAAGLGFGLGWFIEKEKIKYDTRCTTVWGQIFKFIIGISIALAIKSGLKALFGDNIPCNIIRYFLVVLWIVAIFPALVKKFYTNRIY